MSQAARKNMELIIPTRSESAVARAKPVEGNHRLQVENAFKIAFSRYSKAFEELAKV